MQDEINERIVALSIRVMSKGAHLTESALKAAMRKYIQTVEKGNTQRKSEKYLLRGKQTMKKLKDQGEGLSNMAVTNIRSFGRIADKYNIDYALKKDKSADLPRYLVFFKAKDVDSMTAAFKEYSSQSLPEHKKPSVREKLKKFIQRAKNRDQQRERTRQRSKEQQL